jgi:hypothetical protein
VGPSKRDEWRCDRGDLAPGFDTADARDHDLLAGPLGRPVPPRLSLRITDREGDPAVGAQRRMAGAQIRPPLRVGHKDLRDVAGHRDQIHGRPVEGIGLPDDPPDPFAEALAACDRRTPRPGQDRSRPSRARPARRPTLQCRSTRQGPSAHRLQTRSLNRSQNPVEHREVCRRAERAAAQKSRRRPSRECRIRFRIRESQASPRRRRRQRRLPL